MKKILILVLAIAVVACLVGAGSFAIFTDTETSSGNTFTAGSLDLVLSGGDQAGESVVATWSSPEGFKPGDTYTSTLHFSNSGSVSANDINLIFKNLSSSGGKNGVDIMNVLVVSNLEERFGANMTGNQASGLEIYMHNVFGASNGDGILTLEEFLHFCDTPGWYYMAGNPGNPYGGAILNAGNQWDYDFIIGVTFDLASNDDYQGASCSFDLEATALQNTPMPAGAVGLNQQ